MSAPSLSPEAAQHNKQRESTEWNAYMDAIQANAARPWYKKALGLGRLTMMDVIHEDALRTNITKPVADSDEARHNSQREGVEWNAYMSAHKANVERPVYKKALGLDRVEPIDVLHEQALEMDEKMASEDAATPADPPVSSHK